MQNTTSSTWQDGETPAIRPRKVAKTKKLNKDLIEKFGRNLVEAFHLLALFMIGSTVVWSAAQEYLAMMQLGTADLKDILLLFIYLELGAIVGIYFKTCELPVHFLIYIAITALTRLLAIDVKAMADTRVLVLTGGILMLTLAILVLQHGPSKFAKSALPDAMPRTPTYGEASAYG